MKELYSSLKQKALQTFERLYILYYFILFETLKFRLLVSLIPDLKTLTIHYCILLNYEL